MYIGYTKDLKQRLKQHGSTKNVELIYYEAYISEKIAQERERKLKYYGSAWRALKKKLVLRGRGTLAATAPKQRLVLGKIFVSLKMRFKGVPFAPHTKFWCGGELPAIWLQKI